MMGPTTLLRAPEQRSSCLAWHLDDLDDCGSGRGTAQHSCGHAKSPNVLKVRLAWQIGLSVDDTHGWLDTTENSVTITGLALSVVNFL